MGRFVVSAGPGISVGFLVSVGSVISRRFIILVGSLFVISLGFILYGLSFVIPVGFVKSIKLSYFHLILEDIFEREVYYFICPRYFGRFIITFFCANLSCKKTGARSKKDETNVLIIVQYS